jgi:hypothetical protein
MRATIFLKSGKRIVFDPEDPTVDLYYVSGQFFQAVEKYFDDWFENARRDIQEMYEPDENGNSYYFRKGAIHGGIDHIIEYMNETRRFNLKESEFDKTDLDCAFE